jgi:hypothetical protein
MISPSLSLCHLMNLIHSSADVYPAAAAVFVFVHVGYGQRVSVLLLSASLGFLHEAETSQRVFSVVPQRQIRVDKEDKQYEYDRTEEREELDR